MGSEAERLELERLRLLLALASGVIALLDRQGFVIYRSPSLDRPLGYENGMLGKNALEIIHPSDADRVRRTFAAVAAAPLASATELFRVRHADGSWRWLVATATNLLDDPSVAAIVLSFRDVTEQKRAEQEAEAAKKLASLGTLAAGVGHEINNPLTCLILTLGTAARLASHWSSTTSDPNAQGLKSAISEAHDAAERIAAIVRDLRSLVSDEPAPGAAVAVEHAIEKALLMTSSLLAGHAEVTRRYEKVPLVHGSDAGLEQLFVNLLTNAAHALPKGRPENAITIRVRSAVNAGVEVEIDDNGCGIREEDLSRIFDPFFSTRRFSGGTGLGLHIAQRIVQSVGGALSATSRIGLGSTFSVVLRVATPATVAEQPPSAPVQAANGGRVLIVDDDPAVRNALAAALEDHEVVSVGSGRNALELLIAGRRFDAILCDMLMPGLSGIELFAELTRRSPEHARRIVFITGAVLDQELQSFLRAVPNRCVTKPPDREALRRAIAEQVELSRR